MEEEVEEKEEWGGKKVKGKAKQPKTFNCKNIFSYTIAPSINVEHGAPLSMIKTKDF